LLRKGAFGEGIFLRGGTLPAAATPSPQGCRREQKAGPGRAGRQAHHNILYTAANKAAGGPETANTIPEMYKNGCEA